jgi:hypothetical protein
LLTVIPRGSVFEVCRPARSYVNDVILPAGSVRVSRLPSASYVK